jgi:hypothetical protein
MVLDYRTGTEIEKRLGVSYRSGKTDTPLLNRSREGYRIPLGLSYPDGNIHALDTCRYRTGTETLLIPVHLPTAASYRDGTRGRPSTETNIVAPQKGYRTSTEPVLVPGPPPARTATETIDT